MIFPTIDIGQLTSVAGRIAVVVILVVVAQQVVDRTLPRVVALIVRPHAKDAAPLSAADLEQRRNTISEIFQRTVEVLLFVLGTLMVLSAVGIDIAPVLAGAGVAGIAIGFGAQTIVKDLIGGIFILMEDQYREGDVVRIGGVSGLVESITLRRTVLRDLDGIVHSVPNGQVTVASNFTHGWSNVNLDVEVAYKEDLDRVASVLNKIGAELAADPAWKDRILEPPAVLRVDSLGDSGITLKVLAKTVPIEQWNVAGELRRRIKAVFDREGIEIPFPHRTVISRADQPAGADGRRGASGVSVDIPLQREDRVPGSRS